jgi:plasmid stability protein
MQGRIAVLTHAPHLESRWQCPDNAITSGDAVMPAVTIRNLSDATHRALKARAAQHGRSTEAEMRVILETAVHPPTRVRLGTLLAAIGRDADLTEAEAERFARLRETTPAEPPRFE